MSWDVSVCIDTGGEYLATVAEAGNHTSNVAPMYFEAMGVALRDLDEKPALEIIPLLRKGIAEMEDDPGKYRKMNPSNNWGSYESALNFLRKILVMCVAHPKAQLSVH